MEIGDSFNRPKKFNTAAILVGLTGVSPDLVEFS